MTIVKRLADLLTASRVAIAAALLWLSRLAAADLLAVAAVLLLTAWITDTLDGPLARRSGGASTWIGDHDLEIDVLVSLGVLAYLAGAGFLSPVFALAYLALWGVTIWRWGWQRDPSMLFQAPIYLWFILVAMREVPTIGRWLIAYPLVAVVLTWPRFPRQIVPDFLAGMAELLRHDSASR